MSFARIHMILVPTRPHFSVLSSYVLAKKKEGLALCLAHDLMKSGI
jgi:hypothetical protein